jgi:hypothetical protein
MKGGYICGDRYFSIIVFIFLVITKTFVFLHKIIVIHYVFIYSQDQVYREGKTFFR